MKTIIINPWAGPLYVNSHRLYFPGIGQSVGYRHPLLYNYKLWTTGERLLRFGLDKITLYKMV
jgi:hypothetical protein